MIKFYYELVQQKIELAKNTPKTENTKLLELLTLEKEFILDVFKDYWNNDNDSEMNQLEWFLEYLEQECEIDHNLGIYFWKKYQENKYIQSTPTNKLGKCTGCIHFVKNSEDLNKCSCEVKIGYMTQNALRMLYCYDFSIIEE